ncbi:unnamed protein product, partial [Adineta ricciae]
MGCVLGIFTCCFGSTACSLCCACCPATRNSLITRLAYGLLLLIGTIISGIFLMPDLPKILNKIPRLCKNSTWNDEGTVSGYISCEEIVGYSSVYRIQFSFACFFFLMMILMAQVKQSKDFRSGIQNGFWFFKIIIIVGICCAMFFIPNRGFISALMVVGSICGFVFILIQLILIVDFAHSWNENWVAKGEDGSRKHYCGLVFFTTSLYTISIVSVILLYIYYASKTTCGLNIFFITFNFLLCLIISVISVLPMVQNYHSTSGLLQSSFVTVYVIYLTWSAMTNEKPDPICNPANNNVSEKRSVEITSIVGLIIFFGMTSYSAMTSSRSSSSGKLLGMSNNDDIENARPKIDGGKSYDDEKESVAYNYSLFHLMLVFASFY